MEKAFSYAFVYQKPQGSNTENTLKHGTVTGDFVSLNEATGYILNKLADETRGYTLFIHSVVEIEQKPTVTTAKYKEGDKVQVEVFEKGLYDFGLKSLGWHEALIIDVNQHPNTYEYMYNLDFLYKNEADAPEFKNVFYPEKSLKPC